MNAYAFELFKKNYPFCETGVEFFKIMYLTITFFSSTTDPIKVTYGM